MMAMRSAWFRFLAWYGRWPLWSRWIAPLVWMALIFGLSAQPDLPHAPGGLTDLLLKKTGHAVAYGVLYVLLWQALAYGFRPLALAWILTVLYAVSDEFHQTFVPGRNGRFLDVAIDAAGALVAAVVVRGMRRRARGGGR
jgi:VanZ family protein